MRLLAHVSCCGKLTQRTAAYNFVLNCAFGMIPANFPLLTRTLGWIFLVESLHFPRFLWVCPYSWFPSWTAESIELRQLRKTFGSSEESNRTDFHLYWNHIVLGGHFYIWLKYAVPTRPMAPWHVTSIYCTATSSQLAVVLFICTVNVIQCITRRS